MSEIEIVPSDLEPGPPAGDVDRMYQAHLIFVQEVVRALDRGESVRELVASHLVALVDDLSVETWWVKHDPVRAGRADALGYLHRLLREAFWPGGLLEGQVPEDPDAAPLIGIADGKLTLAELAQQRLYAHTMSERGDPPNWKDREPAWVENDPA